MATYEKVPWKVRKEDMSVHEFATSDDALMYACANTTEEHMCVIIMPAGAEFTMLRRPRVRT
jgi:hypothetical protein